MARSRVRLLRAISPRKSPNYQKYISQEIEKVLEDEAGILTRMFEKTTRTWRHRPRFYRRVSRPPYAGLGGTHDPKVIVGTADQIYSWVSHGTKGPYSITPKGPWLLRFQVPYYRKTRKRIIGSRKGGRGNIRVATEAVTHPGIEAREFDLEIADRRQKPFAKKMDNAFRKGAQRARREAKRSRKSR